MIDKIQKHLGVHVFYWMLGLVLAVIILLTRQFSCNEDLVKFVSFASTIASLLLALIAIIYAFIANSDLSGSIGEIKAASEGLLTTSGEMKQITEALKHEVVQLPDRVVKANSSSLNAFMTLQQKSATADSNEDEVWNPKNTGQLLKSLSPIGLFVLLVVEKSYERQKGFKIEDVFSTFPFKTKDDADNFIFGYFIGVSNAGLFEFEVKSNTITITKKNDSLKGIEAILKKRIAILKKGESREHLEKGLEVLAKYFD